MMEKPMFSTVEVIDSYAEYLRAKNPESLPSFVQRRASDPEAALAEAVVKLTRRLCLHNRYFGFLDGVVEAVEEQFADWIKPNETLRRLCAII